MSDFIIYGAASIGDIVRDRLEAHHLNLLGYIDKRAHEIKQYNQLPVWNLENIPQQHIADGVTVFIGVKNVFEHESIARALAKTGFTRIIYKPYNVLLGQESKEETIISQIYDDFFNPDSEIISVDLPLYPVNNEADLHDYAVLEESAEYITAYIPAEFICTNHYTTGGMVKWGDINILSLFTHVEFFRYLDHKAGASPGDYLKEYCEYTAALQGKIEITDAWRSNVIRNRTQIYERMQDNLNLDFAFFVRNAPEAVWSSEKHVFNLTSGKHRSAFFAAKEMKYIPIRMKKKDYEAFYHREAAERVGYLLSGVERNIMIPHPCFYRDDRVGDRGDYAFILWFARYYGKQMFYRQGRVSFQQIRIVDNSDDIGYFARFASRLGCEVYRKDNLSELEDGLNQLFYANIYYETISENTENMYQILVAEEKNMETQMLYINRCKDIIVRHCTTDRIQDICTAWNLKVVLKISEIYEELKQKADYLLRHFDL